MGERQLQRPCATAKAKAARGRTFALSDFTDFTDFRLFFNLIPCILAKCIHFYNIAVSILNKSQRHRIFQV
jgi:hypothetical protein